MIETLRLFAIDAVILLSLVGIAVGRLPSLRMNRATIAFSGAAFLVLLGALGITDAFSAIDLNTIVLILSMMIITANLKLSGFFGLATESVLRAARTPRRLLALVMASSAVLSALFLNDTICIMMTPLVAALALKAKRNPVPYLLGLALSANIGSAATIIGNPQNMLIGASSGLSFARFLSRLAVPSLLGLLVAFVVVVIAFRAEFLGRGAGRSLTPPGHLARLPVYRPLLIKSLAAVALMTIGFFLNIPVALAAMAGAAILLATRRVSPERVFAELDWTILAFFGALFILTEAISRNSAFSFFMARGLPAVGSSMARFSVFTVILSNLVSNVPAVMLLRPTVSHFANPEQFWLVMAMASTYAGNLTLLGSVANLIVAESAKKYGIEIRFMTYLKVGLPTTILTVVIGVFWFTFT